jgi:hypothetical protein
MPIDSQREQRWHQIATEGLPSEEGMYFVFFGRFQGHVDPMGNPCRVDHCDFRFDEWLITDARWITHWWPIVTPEAPVDS